jgi:hypothetical protein
MNQLFLPINTVNWLRRTGVSSDAAMRLLNHSPDLIHKI